MSCENLLQLIHRTRSLHQSCRISVGSCSPRAVGRTMGRGWEMQELFRWVFAEVKPDVFKQRLLQEVPQHLPAPDLTHSLVYPYWVHGPGLDPTCPCPSLSLAACLGLPHYPLNATQHSHSCHHCLTPQLLPAQLAPHITWPHSCRFTTVRADRPSRSFPN